MSIVYDCCHWWRMEFGSEYYRVHEAGETHENGRLPIDSPIDTAAKTLADHSTIESFRTPLNPTMATQLSMMPNFDTFPDWEWASSLGFHNDMNISLPALAMQEI